MDKNTTDTASIVLLIVILIASIGALSFGILGLFQFDLFDFLFHKKSVVSYVIYAIVGFSGLVSLILAWKIKF